MNSIYKAPGPEPHFWKMFNEYLMLLSIQVLLHGGGRIMQNESFLFSGVCRLEEETDINKIITQLSE